MNPILALGQIIVSIALIAAILLQARGTGLSGTFGGDSAVYRSRRGVERDLPAQQVRQLGHLKEAESSIHFSSRRVTNCGTWPVMTIVSMQPHYNLLYREEEREMLPLCEAEGIGVIPWSPLASGLAELGVADRARPLMAAAASRYGTFLISCSF